MAETGFLAFVLDQLRQWGDVSVRPMFGGHGLYRDNRFFAILLRERLYLRCDASNLATFDRAGMRPFRYRRQGKGVALSYREVPIEVIEDPEALAALADLAFAAALRARAKPGRKRGMEAGRPA